MMSKLAVAKNVVQRFLRQPSIYLRNRRDHRSAIELVSEACQTDEEEVRRLYREVARDKELLRSATMRSNYIGLKKVPAQPIVLYLVARLEEPEVVVETGVNTGYSSAFILRALDKNGKGHLYSIDLPGTEQDPVVDDNGPEGEEVVYNLESESEIGFRVLESTKHRWDLRLGDSRELLPDLVDELGSVDIFFHDSLHSYDHMMFEFEAVIDSLNQEGILGSDDIDWNKAFQDFTEQKDLEMFRNRNAQNCIGLARKQ